MNAREMIVWIVALSLAATVLLSPVACTMNRHRVIAEAISGGADPIAAKCAIENDLAHTPMCVLKAAERQDAVHAEDKRR